jgi:hypothetical protein
MKISKADFEQMKAKYDQEVKKGKPGKGKNGEVNDQTDWLFVDRQTLEEILADPKATGIKIYLTEYTEDVAKAYYPEDPEQYVGRLNLVLTGSSDNGKEDILDGNGNTTYYDRAKVCPPYCQ